MDQLAPITPKTGQTAPDSLRKTAEALEASFLAVMLKEAGLGAPRGLTGGGAGEEVYASLLATEQARAFAAQGGIGLAESIVRALEARENGA
ncbi:Rod binding domain-containing protein [Rubricella aquisinus]|uniref:Rod binding domain-containing protein n=1 Tax=Rubricella aquisinus TaxID=2028108 RepID=A0A840WL28_9RHOB|nr:rod-binding protein [Rubricella aquisinus]MBB5515221.1 Rod binding domain-containing protein [Rubricella aquisinus]